MRSKKILPVVLSALLSTSMIGIGASQVKAEDSATSKSSILPSLRLMKVVVS